VTSDGFALFETAIGTCGIAWRGGSVTGVQLPEGDVAATRTRMRRRHGEAPEAGPPAAVRDVIERVRGLLAGGRDDLADVALDFGALPAFHRRVYEIARAIPPGATLTYGEVAARLGEPGAARAVGHALGRNPFPIIVPCHRVLAADGRMHGFSAHGGTTTKRRLLLIEGAALRDPPGLFDGIDAFGRPTNQPPSEASSERSESSADAFSSVRDAAQGSSRKDMRQTRPAGA
jgi:methylated-DNA-[protein]-cysteine S-methyltransferase